MEGGCLVVGGGVVVGVTDARIAVVAVSIAVSMHTTVLLFVEPAIYISTNI